MKVSVETKNVKKELKGFIRRCKDMRPILSIIAMDMKKQIQSNIDKEMTADGKPWKKSKRAIKDGGTTLRDTGRLYNSFATHSTRSTARVGTNVKYARALNYGMKKGDNGRITVNVKPFTRKNGQKVKGHTRNIISPWGDIPERKFMSLSSEQKEKYTEMIKNYVFNNKI